MFKVGYIIWGNVNRFLPSARLEELISEVTLYSLWLKYKSLDSFTTVAHLPV